MIVYAESPGPIGLGEEQNGRGPFALRWVYESHLELTVYFRLDKISLLRSGPVRLGAECTSVLWGVTAVGCGFDFPKEPSHI